MGNNSVRLRNPNMIGIKVRYKFFKSPKKNYHNQTPVRLHVHIVIYLYTG